MDDLALTGTPPAEMKLFLYGTHEDVDAVVAGYQLDPLRVVHDNDFEAAMRSVFVNRHNGIQAHLITIGSDPRDLLRLRPPRRPPGEYSVFDLMEEYEPTRVPVRNEPLPKRITWAMLVKREPRLTQLRAVVDTVVAERERGYNANAVWFRPQNVEGVPGLKYQMTRLVGWHALTDDRVLRSSKAYDVAYRALYDPLPPDLEPEDEGY